MWKGESKGGEKEKNEERVEGEKEARGISNKYDFNDDRPSGSPHFVDVLILLSL